MNFYLTNETNHDAMIEKMLKVELNIKIQIFFLVILTDKKTPTF